jgi:hypothetical protein
VIGSPRHELRRHTPCSLAPQDRQSVDLLAKKSSLRNGTANSFTTYPGRTTTLVRKAGSPSTDSARAASSSTAFEKKKPTNTAHWPRKLAVSPSNKRKEPMPWSVNVLNLNSATLNCICAVIHFVSAMNLAGRKFSSPCHGASTQDTNLDRASLIHFYHWQCQRLKLSNVMMAWLWRRGHSHHH